MVQHGKYRPLVRAIALALVCFWAGPASACRLALVLALDISSSVDAAEDALQRQGLATALVAPEVQNAFFISPDPVALLIFEWSGRYNQQDLMNWTMIRTPDDLSGVAALLATSKRSHDDFPTAIGHALAHAANRLAEAPDCRAQTIDISGDGENNDGFTPQEAYGRFALDGVTINGLVINAAEFEAETQLIPFYRDQVIKGPDAFIEVANGFADFETAMRRKLVRELSALVVGNHTTSSRSPS
ncbi:DUF1194 domain-containing protein [Yoonia sp. 2307UL14-13]|uniref:DUF1194 domain-containing protein n=1 Tax=Yoonia sp. 2307UL14-13 TaxID=3126506 RepID=UPI00309FFE89